MHCCRKRSPQCSQCLAISPQRSQWRTVSGIILHFMRKYYCCPSDRALIHQARKTTDWNNLVAVQSFTLNVLAKHAGFTWKIIIMQHAVYFTFLALGFLPLTTFLFLQFHISCDYIKNIFDNYYTVYSNYSFYFLELIVQLVVKIAADLVHMTKIPTILHEQIKKSKSTDIYVGLSI